VQEPLFFNRQVLIKVVPGENWVPSGTVTSSINVPRSHIMGVDATVGVAVSNGGSVAEGAGLVGERVGGWVAGGLGVRAALCVRRFSTVKATTVWLAGWGQNGCVARGRLKVPRTIQ
jgi:hypothetical protein